jgi:hypothetical protein
MWCQYGELTTRQNKYVKPPESKDSGGKTFSMTLRTWGDQYAFKTLFAFMQLVQTFKVSGVPFALRVRTFWIFGFQVRFVRMWEWLTLYPVCIPLPQTSQLLAIRLAPLKVPARSHPDTA